MTDTVAGDRIDSILDEAEFHAFFDETVGPAVKIAERDCELAGGVEGLNRLLATDAEPTPKTAWIICLSSSGCSSPHIDGFLFAPSPGWTIGSARNDSVRS